MQADRQKTSIRAFIAIELPPEVKELLTGLQAKLRPCTTGAVRWIRPELMHLTLRFIGNIEKQQVKPLSTAIEQAVKGFKGFSVTTGRVGGFPDLKTPKLIYLGLGDSCQLTALSDRINAVIDTEAGSNKRPAQIRKYHPHLTLCRLAKPGGTKGLTALAGSLPSRKDVAFKVDEITLFKSDLKGKSPVYTALRRFALA